MSRIRKVSIALLSWNGRRHLEVCLPALAAQEPPGCEWEVVLLDNGSDDGTSDWVRQHHPRVRLLHSPTNLGFCGGNNRLVAAVDSDAVALLNNDTRPQPQWLRALVAALTAAPADVAAVSGRIVDWSGERLDFARGLLTFDGHAFQHDFGRPLAEVELPKDGSEQLFACGGNMLIRRDSFLAAGGFDESYFAYLEDVDLGWRLWSGGERILFATDATVHHRSMATSALLGTYHRGFLFERNAFLTAYKNYDDELWQRMMPSILLALMHRTQTLLVQNNPGGTLLTLDPYAGYIANTARHEPDEAAADAAAPPRREPLVEKWRRYGTPELLRRGLRKAARAVLPAWLFDAAPGAPHLTDDRTIAQLRVITQLLGNLDRTTAERRRIQARRRRPDRDIFARFPLYLVPTYPGDDRLFASPAFTAALPADPPLRRATLEEIMAPPEPPKPARG